VLHSSRWTCWTVLAGAALLGLCQVGGSRADEPEKGKVTKPGAGQVDLNKLPPELIKQIQAYLAKNPGGKGQKGYEQGGPPWKRAQAGDQKKGAAQGGPPWKKAQGQQMRGAGKGGSQLPPGLANKPADHPGRKGWQEGQRQKGRQKPAAPTKKKPKDRKTDD
jgi:hypothetical protein